MSAPRHVRISATGMYIPKKVLTNEDLVKMGLDTSDEWIRGHIGIRERRIASDEETTLFMGLKAARAALEKSSVKASRLRSPRATMPPRAPIGDLKPGMPCR